MTLRFVCPNCNKTTWDSKPTHIKSVQAIKYEVRCNECKQSTVVYIEAYIELPDSQLKKLDLDKIYLS